jgi:DNA-binding NarL/FixJ family response regulator
MATPLRCLVVDDHQLVAQAVGGLLSELCGFELVVVCHTVAEAIAQMERDCPDLLILDLDLPGERWQDAASALQRLNPQARLVFLSASGDQFTPPPEYSSIVLGVVAKSRAWNDLLAVVHGWLRSADAVARPGSQGGNQAGELPLHRLSPRELRLFLALGRGLLNKQIAQEQGLTMATVETYRKAISAKLNLSGAELVRAAVLQRVAGLSHPPGRGS